MTQSIGSPHTCTETSVRSRPTVLTVGLNTPDEKVSISVVLPTEALPTSPMLSLRFLASFFYFDAATARVTDGVEGGRDYYSIFFV